MFRNLSDLNLLRKWNLVMVVGVVSVLLAQRFFGHIVVWNEVLERALTILAVGLGGGILLQLRKGRGK